MLFKEGIKTKYQNMKEKNPKRNKKELFNDEKNAWQNHNLLNTVTCY